MNDWSARVEWAGDALTGDQAADLAERLEVPLGSVGMEASGNPSAQLHVRARTIRQAFDAAARAVEGACRALGLPCSIVAVDVATWAEFERRQAEPAVPPLVGFADIAERLEVSRQRAREITQTHAEAFPVVGRPASGPLFLQAHLDRFASTWQRKRTGRPRKNPA